MVRALRVVTVERGVDPRRYALLPFGGAGPMHAAALAAELEMTRIVCPRASGVLSALGLVAAGRRRDTARTLLLGGEELTAERLAREVAELAERAREGLGGSRIEVTFGLRYRGQSFELPISGPPDADPEQLAEDFAIEHEARYGYRDPEGELELVTVHVAAILPGPEPRPRAASGQEMAESVRQAYLGGQWTEVRILRGEPVAGLRASGPCVFELPEATLVLPPGWEAEVDATGTVVAEHAGAAP
jgi:N-methylhydantoinase A